MKRLALIAACFTSKLVPPGEYIRTILERRTENLYIPTSIPSNISPSDIIALHAYGVHLLI